MTLRLILGGVVVGALVWLTGAPAAAHAGLVSTDPEEGSVVTTLPDEITLTFNEPVRLEAGGIRAFDANGDEWQTQAVSSDNTVVVTPVDDPGRGTVVVSYTVTSEDGHEVSGALTFSVGEPGGAALATPEAPVTTAVARVAAAGLAALGLLGSIGLALRRSSRADLAWNAGLLGAVLLGPLHSLATDGRGLGGLTDWLAWVDGLTGRSGLLMLAAYAVVALVRRAPTIALGVALVPVLGLAGGAVVTWPQAQAPAVAAAAEPTTRVASGGLGGSGTAELTVTPGTGREVTLGLRLVTSDGLPLVPFAPPTVTVGNGDLSLGEADLTETGEGTYATTVTIPLDGSWSAQVSVRLDEFTNPVVAIPFIV